MKSEPGTYALVLRCPSDHRTAVGRLGTITFEKGYYVYVGSAFGPGGVLARVERHCRPDKRVRWHIDYVRTSMKVAEVWYTHYPDHQEHQWAGTLSTGGEAAASIRGFGSSDCDCKSHLFHFRHRPDLSVFRRELKRTVKKAYDIERFLVSP